MIGRERVTVWLTNTRRPSPVPTCAHCGCWRMEHRLRHSADTGRRFRCNHEAPLAPKAGVSEQVFAAWVAIWAIDA